jgi:chitin-binding protein
MPIAGSGGSTLTGGAGAPAASAGAASGGSSSAGGSSGGTTSGGSSSAGASGNSCANIATWKLSTYSAGDLVQSGGKIYKCKEYPYVGWCGSNVAYAPISGYAWMDAWDLVGPC